jgi:hypothetical protein
MKTAWKNGGGRNPPFPAVFAGQMPHAVVPGQMLRAIY